MDRTTYTEAESFQWLVSAEARPWLDSLAHLRTLMPADIERMRKRLDAELVRRIVEQVELRDRARQKFANAHQMFFTRRGLEQATDACFAQYKAASFSADAKIADLCCGIGGDLMALTQRGPAVGYDLDPTMVVIGDANITSLSLAAESVECQDVTQLDLAKYDAWHADPDRRSDGGRTTHVGFYQPTDTELDCMLLRCPHAMIKLAPVASGWERWEESAEMEWLGHERDCLQLLARFGALAQRKGHRTATFVPTAGGSPISYSGSASAGGAFARDVLELLHEPHPTLRASGLAPSFGTDLGLWQAAPGSYWLTSNHAISHPLLHSFHVLARWPLDRKKVRAHLRAQSWRPVEVKSREASARPEPLMHAWRLDEGDPVCLIVLRSRGNLAVYVTKRV